MTGPSDSLDWKREVLWCVGLAIGALLIALVTLGWEPIANPPDAYVHVYWVVAPSPRGATALLLLAALAARWG